MKTFIKKITFFSVIVSLVFVSPLANVYAQKEPQVESSSSPDSSRTKKIMDVIVPAPTLRISSSLESFSISTTTGPNLYQNASVESGSTTPTQWNFNRWLTNNATFTYPVSGVNGGKAIEVNISSYTSGDAKWYNNDIPVIAGKTYQFSNYAKSNVPSILTIRYKMADGSFTYKYLATISASSDFKQNIYQIIVPPNAVAFSMFHLINQVGTLTTDEYSLNEIITTTTPPDPTPTSTPTTTPSNLILNPDLEIADSSGSKPLHWNSNRWLNNNATFSYPISGVNNSKAVKVTINSYTSGDAKWYFNPVVVSPGTYTYSEQYQSDRVSNVTLQFQHKDGSFSYKGIRQVPQSSTFTPLTFDFTVGESVQNVTVFHVIAGVGSLTIDNASLVLKTQAPIATGIFTTGGVSLAFDDGWASQNQYAIPKMNSVGMKGTFYITSRQLFDNGFVGFVSKANIRDMFNAGHEIGAHTRTHAHLTQLSAQQQQTEIAGSRQDLLAMNVGPINSFAYPFGEYNSASIQAVKDAGMSTARATIRGYNVNTSDKYQFFHQSGEVDTTLDQVKSWVDTAIANKEWLILTFHRVDTSGDRYSVTPTMFNQIVDYLVSKNVVVKTVSDAASAVQ